MRGQTTLARTAAALTLLSGAFAENLQVYVRPQATDCTMGCMDALTVLTFGDIPATAGYYDGYCGSDYFKSSMVLSMETYCTESQMAVGWKKLSGYCEEYGEVELEAFESVAAKINKSAATEVNVLEGTQEVNGTVLISYDSWKAGFKTERVWDREMIFHHAFGWAMFILLGVAVLIGFLRRVYSAYLTRLIVSAGTTGHSEMAPETGLWSRIETTYMKVLGEPALLGNRHVNSYALWSLPTRLEGACIFIYVALNIIFSFVGYELFHENMYWPGSYKDQVWRYIADRTAIMSFYNIPLLWVLAGRNDVILYLTGWSFASMNIFHRWVARVTVLQGIIHSIAWTIIEWDYYDTMFAEMYWSTGVAATVVMSLLLPFSIKPIRERWYEIFLITHIVLAVATIVLLFYHVTVYDGEYNPYLWACVAVWCLDRFLRYVRVGALSYKAAAGDNSELIATGGPNGLIRLTVTSSIRFTPQPGQHYYLYTPKSITPWENHPFTLGSWEAGPKGETILHFLVGTKQGATRRMRKMVAKAEGGRVPCRVLLEGPYGHSCPVERFDQALFVGGGSGITAALPYLHDLAARAATGKAVTKRVTLVWVVKNNEYAEDVLSRELANVQNIPGLEVALHIYITAQSGLSTPLVAQAEAQALPYSDNTTSGSSGSHPSLPSSPTAEKSEKLSTPSSLAEGVHTGRPEMQLVLESALAKLVGAETLAVLACGPGGMMDDMRRAVCGAYGNGEGQMSASRLEYFEESFSW
ncbi:hypothetical protein IAT38_002416 [Cryptococcus sp. DSM 104549]